MEALSKDYLDLTSEPTTSCTPQGMSTIFSQAMHGRHYCPCCSNMLLPHLRSGEVHWRCSHCYQEMPV